MSLDVNLSTDVTKWASYGSRAWAMSAASVRNANPKDGFYVVVEGPDDDEWTVMPLADAIENEFLYEWSIR